MSTCLFIDICRAQPNQRPGRKYVRRASLDSAAILSRHFWSPRHTAADAENAGGQVSGTARRQPDSARTPARCGSSGLRSLGVAQGRQLPPQRPRPRSPPDPSARRNGLTDRSRPLLRGPQNGAGGADLWPDRPKPAKPGPPAALAPPTPRSARPYGPRCAPAGERHRGCIFNRR